MRKALYLMGILDDADVEWLGSAGSTKYVRAGTVLIQENTTIEDVYIVLDGELSIRSKALDNREIGSLLAGEIVGEISFVDSRPPSASVLVSHDSHVLVIPRAILSNKLKADSAFSARFYKAVATLLADRLRKTVSYLGYGEWREAMDPDELDEPLMDSLSMGATRFDRLLKRLRIN
jgi:CRP/FNR family transcriptional regulator, cyclic AMP receptor protein